MIKVRYLVFVSSLKRITTIFFCPIKELGSEKEVLVFITGVCFSLLQATVYSLYTLIVYCIYIYIYINIKTNNLAVLADGF